MPTIYEYMGIKILFFSREHFPIHIHALYGGTHEMKVEFYLAGGKITKIIYKGVKGKRHLPATQLKDLKAFVKKYQYEIVEKWITFVVKGESVKAQKIIHKIK